MTEEPVNKYGVVTDGESYDFKEWSWDYVMPDNLVDLISCQAAKLVLEELIKEARLTISEANETPLIEFSTFEGDVAFVYPLASAFDDWIEICLEPYFPATANRLITVLEETITKLRDTLTSEPEETL